MNEAQLDNIAARIEAAAARLGGPAVTPAEQADAAALLRDMLEAAHHHGVGLALFDYVADLPQMALMVVRSKREEA
ncbi:hypothetical protein [Streptomyces sp. NPDC002722]|uniref:hypothetical protein n=1 Tax=Streptomyces sp. NPDC002722 TaxID=3154425 RepID=UPI00332CAA9A